MPKLKKWILKKLNREDQARSAEISSGLGIGRTLSDILVQRGYNTVEDASNFLKKGTMFFHDPFLMNDMRAGVERIFKAIENGEHITVYGDYDVDGVTSVSTLYLYLTDKGASVDIYIPNRAGEGYGMNVPALDKLAKNGTDLIITVDTGITAIEEALYLKSLGMEMVVTDHHHCQEQLPEAVAVINPRRPDNTYPFEELAGVGVVFKLICALEKTYQTKLGNTGNEYLLDVCQKYCDLVAIGTIADVMPLRDENRLICAAGLGIIGKNPREGLRALMDQTEPKNARGSRYPKKRKINATYIGFTIAPKINAAGRLGDAMDGVRLFLATTRAEADSIAEMLCSLNVQRQAEENRIAAEAIELAETTHDFEKDSVLVLAKENWHHGVIGIVASRLTERYNMPTLLITIEDGIGKGSGRSIKGLNLSDALSACSDTLIRYGGHELAAGLTVSADKIDELRRRLNEYASNCLTSDDVIPTLEIDHEVEDKDITVDFAEEMALLEPCGVDNLSPMLMRRNAVISEITSIGGGKHTKILLRSDGSPKTALAFGVPASETDLAVGDVVDIAFQIDVNEFQNVKNAQMLVKDARLCEAELTLYDKEMEFYKKVTAEEERFSVHDRFLPDRNDFATVYTALKKLCAESDVFGLHKLYRTVVTMNPTLLPPMRMSKIKLCVRIFADVGLISFEELPNAALSGTELYRIRVKQVDGKVNLEGAPRFKQIKKQLKRESKIAE